MKKEYRKLPLSQKVRLQEAIRREYDANHKYISGSNCYCGEDLSLKGLSNNAAAWRSHLASVAAQIALSDKADDAVVRVAAIMFPDIDINDLDEGQSSQVLRMAEWMEAQEEEK